MARIDSFAAVGIAFDPESPLSPAMQLVERIRLAVASKRIAKHETLPSIRAASNELGVHLNTIRKVYRVLEQQGLVVTRHGHGTTVGEIGKHDQAVAELAAEFAERAKAANVDVTRAALALLAGAGAQGKRRAAVLQTAAKQAHRATRFAAAAVPADALRRGATIGLVSTDSQLVLAVERAASTAGARLRVADTGDAYTIGDLAWACSVILLGPDAAGDAATTRALRGARDVRSL